MLSVAVIGSGPAGTFCAKALVKRGFRVTIFDVGEELAAEKQALADRIGATPPADWEPSDIQALAFNSTVATGIPRKFLFGSDFAYGNERPFFPVHGDNRDFQPSFARGGYSVVWGAAALPVDDCDLTDWPISRRDLEPHFKEVLDSVPLSSGDGTLERAFPTYCDQPGRLAESRQSAALHADLRRAEAQLSGRNILFGTSRLAVQAMASGPSRGCEPCGLCLTGCPRNAIYNTDWDLSAMISSGAVEYVSGTLVETLDETDIGVELMIVHLAEGRLEKRTFSAVFVGAGALSTARLLLASRRIYERAVQIKDSQKFLLPVLRPWATKGAASGRHLALANTFIEMKVPELSDHWVHLQISPVNYTVLQRLGIQPGAPPGLRARLLTPLLDRLMIAWCGAHSDHGATIAVSLAHPEGKTPPALKVVSTETDRVRRDIRTVSRAIFRAGLLFRSLFVVSMLQTPKPGTGYHCGGTFPMRQSPKDEFDSDVFGRPFGWRRVYAVDGSVFPSIPGTTVALNIMANAHRIGSIAEIEP